MDSNVAKASAVTVLGCRPRHRRPCGRPQLAVARPAGQDRHRRGQPAIFDLATQYKEELRKYGVEVDVRRTTRVKDKEGRSTLRPLEGRLTLRALVDDNFGITAAFVKGDLVGSLQGRLATREAKRPACRVLEAALGRPAVPRADLGLHPRRPADQDAARPQGQAHHPGHARQRLARHCQAAPECQRRGRQRRHLHRRGASGRCRPSAFGRRRRRHRRACRRYRQDPAAPARSQHPPDGLHARRRKPTPTASPR